MADDKSFLGANDIAEILGCSASYAYNIIWQLNAELQEKKYITVRGKVNAKYFYKRVGLADD